jgi:crossover junction endodeoxyribonuclease RuvC
MTHGDNRNSLRLLGIDTALRSTGYGIIEARGNSLTAVAYGCIRIPADRPLSACLAALHAGIDDLIARHAPAAAVLEGVFFCKNVRTAVVLGEARGAVISACAARNVPVFEYSPRRVKQAVVGHGDADKSQVRRMIMSLLGLRDEPQEDAGDALAVALCHYHHRSAYAALAPEPI